MIRRLISRFYLLLFSALLSTGIPAALHGAVNLDLVPGKVLTYIPSPDFWDWAGTPSAGVFTSDPEIAVLTNGSYLITHTTFHGDAVPGDVYMFRSTDKGETWTNLPLMHDLSSGGSFFYNGGSLYLMGGRYIIRSDDNGTTWTTPVSTNSGIFTNLYATWTPNNPVLFSNRIWSAAYTRIQSAPANSNLLDQASWKWSGNIAGNTNWFDGQFIEMTESQVVAAPGLGVLFLPKVRDLPYMALLRADSSGGATFDPVNNFAALPGGEKKFGATYDPVSGKFYVLSNPVLPAHAGYKPWWESESSPAMIRNTTAVLTSRDLFNWKVEKIFLYCSDIDHNAFQYCNFDFDDTNMVIASRTAFDAGDVNPPPRGHDSNMVTFHRINDFRNIAPDHYLTISGNQILRYERTPDTKDDDAPLGGFTLGSTALTSPNGMSQTAAGDIYIREATGRILHFDAAGNFIETNSSAPVSFQSTALTVLQPTNGECSWSRSGSGDWFEPLSWYYWGRPDTTEEIAVFGSAATAATTVNIPSATQIWSFNTDGDKEGWAASNTNYLNMVITNGVLQGTANYSTSGVYVSRSDRFFYGSTVPEVRIRMKADVNCPVYFYWGTTLAVPSAPARRLIGSYTGNGDFQDLVFSMAGNANWDGQAITLIRFDPQVQTNVAGSRGFAIDTITVPKETHRVKGLRFRSANPYTLSGGGQLRIEADSGTGAVEVLQGRHTNDVALILGSDTEMVLTNNTSLHLKLGINLNGKTLHVSGSGRLLMQDSLVMNGGTLAVSGETPLTFTNNSTGAVLDGTLQLLPEGTFAPTNGASFDLLDNPSVLGTKKFTEVSLPVLPSGQQWNTNALYTSGSVAVEAVQHSLTVVAPYGNANPPAGTNWFNYGSTNSSAISSPVLNGTTTQYVCRGWSGTGSVPASGTSTNTGSFTLTTNSTLTWLWTTNYWLDTATNGNGSVNVSDGWKTNGASVQITATPGADWLFTAWSGNTNGCTINGNIITAPMTAARTITANFEIDPLSLPNTWQVNASGIWTNPVNWTDGIIPGISGGSNSADIVIFSATLTTNRVVTVDANRNIGGIIFANAANVMQPVPQTTTNAATTVGYTLSGGTIKLSNGGVIQGTNESGTNTSTISSAIVIQGNGGSATFRNDAPGGIAGLVIGAVTGTSTVGNVTTLYLDGVSTSSGIGGNSRNNLVGAIGNGTGGGKLVVVKNGTGLWTLSANSTYTGGLFVNAGTIRYFGNGTQFGGAGSIITLGTNVTLSHANGALITNTQPLVVNGDFSLIGSANTLWTGAVDLGAATRTITVSTSANTNNTFSGRISNGGLVKAGTGELILSGTNTYALGTIVSAGTLTGASNSALGTNNITVAGGATLTLNATNCINNAALLTLATNAVLNLNFTGADTVGGISRDSGATWLPPGTYNAAALGATGTGRLTIPATSFLLIIK